MRYFLNATLLLVSFFSAGQYHNDSIIKANKIKRIIITEVSLYGKSISDIIYDANGKELRCKLIDSTQDENIPLTVEWQSFYKDTFLTRCVYKTKKGIGSVTIYEYDRQAPFRLIGTSTNWANGRKDAENYSYNADGKLESTIYLSNDSSYSNGLRYTGENLYFENLQEHTTLDYIYDKSGLLQKTECNNAYRPLYNTDSVGCNKAVYSRVNDTIVQTITNWHWKLGKTMRQAKQVLKNGVIVYEETEFGDIITRTINKNKRGLITQEIVWTISGINKKKWKQTSTYKYFF